jgi:hypothetical protein
VTANASTVCGSGARQHPLVISPAMAPGQDGIPGNRGEQKRQRTSGRGDHAAARQRLRKRPGVAWLGDLMSSASKP